MKSEIFYGIVERGEGRATQLGFPTVNIPLGGEAISGIYAAEVETPAGIFHAAVFADPSRGLIEAHLLDFSDDLYGKKISIELKKKLRERAPIADNAALSRMIAEDVQNTRRYFSGA